MAEVSFGEWLRRRRKALDLTQEQLAQQISCSTSELRKLEAEERRPSEQIIEQLAEVFHIAQNERAAFLKFARGNWEAAPTGVNEANPWLVLHFPESESKAQLVTFLFTDIEGSTRLAQQYRDTWEVVRKRHHAILREAMESHHGHIFQVVGDGFCAAFPTPKDSLNAAIDAQRKLQTENWDKSPIKVRMGIHTGEAELQDNEYHGYLTLSLVQRLMSAGHGGQILLSHPTENLLRGQLPKNIDLRDLGEYKFKDVFKPVRVFQVIAPDLQTEFPALRALDVFPHNLPIQLTSFIGRESEMAEAKQLLANTRLLTLTGPGGTGKTRLSLQIAQEVLPEFTNGVWLVELAPITDAKFMVQTAVAVFGITAERDRPALETLKDYLRAKSLLLILDNCEHLVEDCARFAETILQAAPNVKILATSREALGIRGEQIYHVPPLSTPQSKQLTTSEELTQFESVQLFIERAALVSPNFHLTRDNTSAIAQICLHLDGLPLGIELAAAHTRSMPVEQIAFHIDDRFHLLTRGSRTALPRQQTLQAAIEWSYDLLTEPERILLRRLTVFFGGWTLESAEAVCAGETIDSFAVMDLLSRLVEKSLVLLDTAGRYKFLETIRQYARDKLLESGEIQAIRQRHLMYFLVFTETKGTETLGSNQIAALQQLDEEYENIREAMDWAIETGQMEEATRIGMALAPVYWQSRALFQEAYDKMTLILNHPATTKEKLFRAAALTASVFYAYASFMKWDLKQSQAMIEEAIEILELAGEQGKSYLAMVYGLWGFCMVGKDNAVAKKALDTGLAMAREVNDQYGLANLTEFRGNLARIQQDYFRAQELSNEAIRLFREMGNYYGIARGLGNIGLVFYSQGDYPGAQKYFEEALAIYRNIADKSNLIFLLGYLGRIFTLTAKYVQARELFEEGLSLAKDRGSTQQIGSYTRDLAYLELYEGNPTSALALFRESLPLFESSDEAGIALSIAGIASAIFQLSPQNAEHAAQLLGSSQFVIDRIGIDSLPYEKEQITKTLIAVLAYLGEADYQEFTSQGKAMTLEVAIALAQKVAHE